jgi:uncharacterized protein YjiS (DUF1127 family)
MNTIHFLVRSHSSVPARLNLGLLKGCWSALLNWRAGAKLRARLSQLTDTELHDMGITRSEIDYVALNRAEDPGRLMR